MPQIRLPVSTATIVMNGFIFTRPPTIRGSKIFASAHSGIDPLDRKLNEGDHIRFGTHELAVLATPGHTDGCISFVLEAQAMVFTGDSLLIRGCGRTDFQQGSASKLFHSIKDKLFALPDDYTVYPGHDYVGRTASSIGEEKMLNPRIGGAANEQDFVGFLDNMTLPHPKKLDVRTRVETDEESTRLNNAVMIPINELRERIGEVPTGKPVMTICRSGKRSVLAFTILRNAGVEQVANIKGGLIRWVEEGLPVA